MPSRAEALSSIPSSTKTKNTHNTRESWLPLAALPDVHPQASQLGYSGLPITRGPTYSLDTLSLAERQKLAKKREQGPQDEQDPAGREKEVRCWAQLAAAGA
jgi:hypothetical protein